MITINLLPSVLREEIGYSKKNKSLLFYLYTLVVLCFLLIASFVIASTFLGRSVDFFADQIKSTEKALKSYDSTYKSAKDMETRVNDFKKTKKSYLYWSKFNQALDELTPQGVYLTGLDVQGSDVKMHGYAMTKHDLATFQKSLTGYEGFTLVNVESIKESNDGYDPGKIIQSFELTMKITKEGLQ